MWHPNPEITALMNQACSMISTKEAAVPILDRVIELEPMYYEVELRPVLHQYSDTHSQVTKHAAHFCSDLLVCALCEVIYGDYICMQYIGRSLSCFLQFYFYGVTCVFQKSYCTALLLCRPSTSGQQLSIWPESLSTALTIVTGL